MQTILGSNGAIGTELAKQLRAYSAEVRLVSRNPKKVDESNQLFPADLNDRNQVFNAVKGSDIIYLTVGFDYNIKVWRKQWPALMRNVIDACKQFKAKLVFFDNIYMYDRDYLGNMTEETPIRPTSKKGQVRAELHQMIMSEITGGSLRAAIARCADFYGPVLQNSFLMQLVYLNFSKGKRANWLADSNKKHSFTYTVDAARGTAILGNTDDSYDQVWHLPTDNNPLTGKEWIELFANEMKVRPRYFVASKWMVSFMGFFNQLMREMSEMIYQYDRDYFFNSSKFQKRFNYKSVTNVEGVRETLNLLKVI